MKITMTISLYCLLAIALVQLSVSGCKKVDNDLAATNAMLGISGDYPRQVITGDTITLIGRLQVDEGGTISLGNAQALLFYKGKITDTTYQGDMIVYNHFDIVRFVVTLAMGSGPQPLIVRSGSHVLVAPDITILAPPQLPYPTDTTLQVTELAGTIPSFSSRYAAQSGDPFTGSLISGCSVTGNGEIWLQAALDIYHYHAGQVDDYWAAGNYLTLDGQVVTIKRFSGVAADPGGMVIYASLTGILPGGGTNSTHYYLVRQDLGSGNITVLNHTVVSPNGTQPSPARETGPIRKMPIEAGGLKVDATGRLLFTDLLSGFVGRMELDSNVTAFLESRYTTGTGKLKYSQLLSYSPDGLSLFYVPEGGGIVDYDLQAQGPIAKIDEKQPLPLVSFETRPEYRFSRRFLLCYTGALDNNASYPLAWLALSSGELLNKPRSLGTIVSYNLPKAAVYAYAGLEIAFDGNTPASQQNVTGPAPWVNYGVLPTSPADVHLIGTDAANNIYFIRGGENNGSGVTIPKIYRLGK